MSELIPPHERKPLRSLEPLYIVGFLGAVMGILKSVGLPAAALPIAWARLSLVGGFALALLLLLYALLHEQHHRLLPRQSWWGRLIPRGVRHDHERLLDRYHFLAFLGSVICLADWATIWFG